VGTTGSLIGVSTTGSACGGSVVGTLGITASFDG
jgi:hypothetical protein